MDKHPHTPGEKKRGRENKKSSCMGLPPAKGGKETERINTPGSDRAKRNRGRLQIMPKQETKQPGVPGINKQNKIESNENTTLNINKEMVRHDRPRSKKGRVQRSNRLLESQATR